MNILEEIVLHKRKEVDQNKRLTPFEKLEESLFFNTKCVSFSHYIKRKDKNGIIAEFKRRSPSKPNINLYADPKEISVGYMQAGASAISVLTDGKYFGGREDDLITARKYNYAPILRKEFIIDEYQIIEAKSIGADAILLIAEILDVEQLKSLASTAQSIGLEVLMELHSVEQLDKLNDHVNVIGVNNRNLQNFVTDINYSIQIFDSLPADIPRISESGINSVDDAFKLYQKGYDGFLIGELFMRDHSPAKACENFINHYIKLKEA